LGLRNPLRWSSAGVWIAPAAATTARARTVTRQPSALTASTPVARPLTWVTRRAVTPA
jgi:hypothetical protein